MRLSPNGKRKILRQFSSFTIFLITSAFAFIYLNSAESSTLFPVNKEISQNEFNISALDCSEYYPENTDEDNQIIAYLTPNSSLNQQVNVSYHVIGEFELDYQCI